MMLPLCLVLAGAIGAVVELFFRPRLRIKFSDDIFSWEFSHRVPKRLVPRAVRDDLKARSKLSGKASRSFRKSDRREVTYIYNDGRSDPSTARIEE
jgi:hypothetical protein